MSINVGKLLVELRRMTVPELQERYLEVHGEPTRSHHKDQLIRKIAWRVQAIAEGDLAERAHHIRQRAAEIANDADLRAVPPAPAPGTTAPGADTSANGLGGAATTHIDAPADARLPMPGTLLTRQYKGRTINVRVLPDGFDYEGEVYRSLSAVAKAVTGAHWNGYLFFGLKESNRETKR